MLRWYNGGKVGHLPEPPISCNDFGVCQKPVRLYFSVLSPEPSN